MHMSSHLILCFITSFIRQALYTKVDQHLLIFVSSPGTQYDFSLTPGVSLPLSSLSQGDEFGFFSKTPTRLAWAWTQLPHGSTGSLWWGPCSFPARKPGYLEDFSRRVVPLLEWADLLSLIGFKSLAIWPGLPVEGVSRLSGPHLQVQPLINTVVTPGAMNPKWH